MNVSIQYSITGTNASEMVASLEEGIRTGQMPQGTSLPTVRALATALHVSPTTVATAYRILQQRGLLTAQGRRGTRVSLRPPLGLHPAAEVPRHLQNLAYGNPDPALLPPLQRLIGALDLRPHLYGQPPNRSRLLSLAAQWFAADQIPATSLAVLGGALDAIERVLQAHLRLGDRVAVEDPGYSAVYDLLRALGLRAEPVAMDDYGLIPDALERVLRTGVAACILTPRAHNPTGAALDAHRARDLRQLFDASGDVLVIEDDYAGPIAGVPACTVCHQAKARWAVVRSVSKALGPDLRLALLAGDATTVARVEGRQQLGAGWVSHILQGLVEALWTDATTAAHLQAAAACYTARRTALLEALAGHGIAARGRSGLNVWIPVPDEVGVVTSMAAAGWAIRAGEHYRLHSPPAVRVTIATLQPPEAIRLAADLARSLQPTRRTPSA